MKKLSSFDSFSTSMPISPISTDEHKQGNSPVFITAFEAMLDEDSSHEKKRRLSVDQVRELEKNFEVDNKLDPERKMKLALEVGLHPRQVSVWFQNRRARWKNKQLEKDYVVLKSNYEYLKQKMEKLHLENQAILQEIEELKSKLQEDSENHTTTKNTEQVEEEKMKLAVPVKFLGGPYDSDSNNTTVSSFVPLSSHLFNGGDNVVEHNLLGEEDSCSSLFSVDQAPSLHWYSTQDWELN